MKDSRVVTLNTKCSKFTTPATNTNSNTIKNYALKGLKNTEDENTDNQANNENFELNKTLTKNMMNNNQDTVQVISMSQKNTPIKNNRHSKQNEKNSNLNDLYDLSDVNLSPMREKSEKIRKDFYGNAILRRGKKHRVTFVDFIKKGNLEDVVHIKKINELEESLDEVEKKNSDSKKSNNSNKDKKKVENTQLNASRSRGSNGNNDECSCACLIF